MRMMRVLSSSRCSIKVARNSSGFSEEFRLNDFKPTGIGMKLVVEGKDLLYGQSRNDCLSGTTAATSSTTTAGCTATTAGSDDTAATANTLAESAARTSALHEISIAATCALASTSAAATRSLS